MTSSDSRTIGDLQELAGIRTRLEAAENAGDADAIAAVMADDVVVMVPSEPVQEGRAECAAFIRRTLAETYSYFDRRIVYTTAEVRVAGDVAFDRGTFAFEVQPKSGGEKIHATGKYFWLYSRSQDDGWKVARAIVSLDAEEEAEAAG